MCPFVRSTLVRESAPDYVCITLCVREDLPRALTELAWAPHSTLVLCTFGCSCIGARDAFCV